ncbi:hypothetical protein GCM10010981_17320 [Dyella nitratireducens]|uniref:Tetratricopeptide repeat protein n=1 Tax=Dyella nitratireducens TaxID=1849580 RepID=A0ABQ1FUC6_9GAMM|nr:hypothetical protein GCM10010981_17320 [Dyella nitratireducens]GLQ43203.1 hypothetical protein GCM10007902_30530 [Dyella nitratireducens]
MLGAGDHAAAIEEFRRAVSFDPNYSAAWKLLGKACLALHDEAGAVEAWRQGIGVAQQRGDKQAEKEMTVFLRRVEQKGKG